MRRKTRGAEGGRAAVALALAVLAATGCASPGYPGAISSDRPDALYAPDTVARGSMQAEVGLVAFQQEGEASNLSFDGLVRVGVAEGVEVRASLPASVDLGDGATGGGVGDVGFGAKFYLFEGMGWIPRAGLVQSVTIPLLEGDDGEAVAVALALALAYPEVIADIGFGLTLGSGLTYVSQVTPPGLDAQPSYYLATNLVRNIGISWITAYIQFVAQGDWAFEQQASLGAGGGLLFALFDDLQLDLYADAGLTDPATDLVMGAGVTARFDFLYY